MVSLAQGLKNAGYEIDTKTAQLYGKHIEEPDEKYQDSLKQIKKLMFMLQPAPLEICRIGNYSFQERTLDSVLC